MSNTSNLVLPYLAVGQAQKHVTVNETLRKLDAIIQLSVVSATTTTEPSTPTDGAVYIVPAGKSGTHWAAFANWSLGYYRDGAWAEISPREGWLAFVRDTDQLLSCTGSAWSLFPAAKLLTVSATDKLIGRSTSGAGAAEEIACTAAGRALIDDADAAAQRATLGLGTAATQNTGTSGAAIPLLNGANTVSGDWSYTSLQAMRRPSSGAGPAASGNSTAGISARIGSSNVGAAGYGLDFGVSNADGTIWLQARDWNDYASSAAIRINPNGGQVNFGGALTPLSDNALALGAASFRWSVVYAGTGAINTSDAREKTALRTFSDAERRAIRRAMSLIGVFQWLGAVAAKGEAARLHIGVTAQAVADAFTAEGLDPARYALWCADPLMEEFEAESAQVIAGEDGEPDRFIPAATALRPVLDETGAPVMRLGVRYDQLFAMALAVLFGEQA